MFPPQTEGVSDLWCPQAVTAGNPGEEGLLFCRSPSEHCLLVQLEGLGLLQEICSFPTMTLLWLTWKNQDEIS